MKSLAALTFLMIGLAFRPCLAQQSDLWSKVREHNASQEPRSFLYHHNASLRWSWNPIQLGLRTGIFIYQKKITYQFASRCIYTPSCSEFGRQCFEKYGPAKALMLTLDRISRCNPSAAKVMSPFDRVSMNGHVHYLDPPSRYQFRKSK